jgi:2-polyprenyl-3-methyl-5-hydroxy-6-metoxy-1,4-benzoquinol methylase
MRDPSVLFAAAQAHYRAGRMTQAQARCERLLDGGPYHLAALRLLAQIAYRDGDNAQSSRRSSEMARLALAQGDADAALQGAVAAVSAAQTPETRRLFADVAGALRYTQDDPIVRDLLIRALDEHWGPAAPLARAAAGLVRAADGGLEDGRLEDDRLLRALLAAAPVTDDRLEAALTRARRRLLENGGDAAFAAALAQQNFLNGYVFWQDDEEGAAVAAVSRRIAGGEDVSDTALAALACYVPLHAVAGIESRAGSDAAMAALLRQQRDEPAEEKRLAAALPALTPMTGPQDSDTPWPRWHGLAAAREPVTLRRHLQQRFPHADLAHLPDRPALLAAGCGTGEYPLHLAATLALADVTAIDIDRTALAYAARKAKAAGLPIRFGQGDILQAAALGRRFGLIECGGVLHQLADPLAGWRALLAVLAPGGVMRVAVHSAVAQAQLARVRALVAAEGFAPTPDGIRAARHWLKARNDASLAPVLEAPVFFSDGGCRHLLFAREHPLALPQIAAFLAANGLAVIGLDVAPGAAAAYRARFPDDSTLANLDNWALFEQDTPQTFAAMIQLWVHKRG